MILTVYSSVAAVTHKGGIAIFHNAVPYYQTFADVHFSTLLIKELPDTG